MHVQQLIDLAPDCLIGGEFGHGEDCRMDDGEYLSEDDFLVAYLGVAALRIEAS